MYILGRVPTWSASDDTPDRRDLSPPEVAEALGRSPLWVKRNWRRLHQDKGFPAPLPAGNWAWSRAALLRWIVAAAGPVSYSSLAANDDDAGAGQDLAARIVAMQREALAARYGARP